VGSRVRDGVVDVRIADEWGPPGVGEWSEGGGRSRAPKVRSYAMRATSRAPL
jgi:hypothetical protein